MATTPIEKTIPNDWDVDIHKIWLSNNQQPAIQALVEKANSFGKEKPKSVLVQLAYYLFLLQDYPAASEIFKKAHTLYPDDNEILLNLGVCFSRARKDEEAITYLSKLLKKNPRNYVAWDSLSGCYHRIGNDKKSAKAGTNSLIIKDKHYGQLKDSTWSIPSTLKPLTDNKKKVIAFSLWGNEKRYVFGALRNLLLAPDLYPDWELWFYVDSSVSPGFFTIIESLGGKVLIQADDQSQKEKLCWRFHVANDASVGYFLVRDIDSVFSVRESLAVDEWMASGKAFHIIRDWWTHTDLILAGLWGGISGVLPDLSKLVKNYQPESVSTPNVDQWFLRDCVWQYVKQNCLVHDRCFQHNKPRLVPGKIPPNGDHIGACEHYQKPGLQEKLLSAWISLGSMENKTDKL